MSLHMDENAVRDRHAEIAGKSAKRKSRKVWVLAAVGTLFAGSAAFAAVQILGSGTFESTAAELKPLTVRADTAKFTKSLVPGATVGATGVIENPNDFPVQVTAIVVKEEGLQASGPGCKPNTLHLKGVKDNYGAAGTGYKIAVTPKTIGAGGADWVTAAEVLSQDEKADALCTVKANFTIVAQVGS
jgi:hypothetical protein